MASGLRSNCALWMRWWVERNPSYLLSAIAMAYGARWLLVSPRQPAGDIPWILATLGVVQAYVLILGALFVWLTRGRRSPEDRVTLLLLATIFWTGPLAATMELAARDRVLGGVFAMAAAILAVAQLVAAQNWARVQIGAACAAVLAAVVSLLALAPLQLRLPTATAGDDALVLYGVWVLLAVLTAAGALAARHQYDATFGGWEAPAIVAINLLVGAAQIAGLNYAFWARAEIGCVAPWLAACCFWPAVWRGSAGSWRTLSNVALIALPLASVVTANAGADDPYVRLPWPLHDRLGLCLLATGAAWLWVFARGGGSAVWLHSGSAVLGLAVLQFVGVPLAQWRPAAVSAALIAGGATPAAPQVGGVPTLDAAEWVTVATFVVTGHFALCAWLRRSRIDALIALAANYVALGLLLTQHSHENGPLMVAVAGWTWIAFVHVARHPPPWVLIITPVALLLAWNIAGDLRGVPRGVVYGHALLLPAVLWGLAIVLEMGLYRVLAITCGLSLGLFFTGRAAAQVTNIGPLLVVLTAFGLLGLGAWISWNKRRLLAYAAVWGEPTHANQRAAS